VQRTLLRKMLRVDTPTSIISFLDLLTKKKNNNNIIFRKYYKFDVIIFFFKTDVIMNVILLRPIIDNKCH
jgi:hypothetical protein